MPDSSHHERITPKFNLLLFIYVSVIGLLTFLASDKASGATPLGLVLSIALDFVFVVAALFIGTYFLREFWNRLITDLFAIRSLSFQEAMAFALIMSLILS